MAPRASDRLLAPLVAVLVLWNNVVVPRVPRPAYAAVNAAATAVLLAAARSGGLSWAELGLARSRVRGGARLGGALALPVMLGYAAALALPRLRPVLRDARVAGLAPCQVAIDALVRIPVGTVVWEEVAFRGVLSAALARALPSRAAATVGAAAFGLWHVQPTLDGLAVNDLAPGPARRVAAVVGGCALTGAAGALLEAARRRSGSLLAPALLHLAANDVGLLAARAAVQHPGLESSRSARRTGRRE